jgi:hypothetical protein
MANPLHRSVSSSQVSSWFGQGDGNLNNPSRNFSALLNNSHILATVGNVTPVLADTFLDTSLNNGIYYRVYHWTGSGSFTLSKGGLLDVLLIGGGGGGATTQGGGGGAGGHVYRTNFYLPAGTHTVTIGGGSGGGNSYTNYGGDTYISAPGTVGYLVAVGGGGGGFSAMGGYHGGSSGGSSHETQILIKAVSGQGNTGDYPNGYNRGGGGGGDGAAAAGGAGAGGAGLATFITGSSVSLAGGGGGNGAGSLDYGRGTSGGGSGSSDWFGVVSTAGTANTGGGGGGGTNSRPGSAGGSGIARIRVLA